MPAFSPSFPDLRLQCEAQVEFFNQVARHTLDTVGQLSDLNLRMSRQAIDDGIRLGRALAACNDPVQMSAVAMRGIPSTAEGWRSWHGALLNVLTAGGATLARDANDGSWQAARSAAGAAEDVGAAHNPT